MSLRKYQKHIEEEWPEELKERFEILELHSYQIVKEVEREKFV